MKGLAYRRHHRKRMIARATQIMKTWGNNSLWIDQTACRWADNMKKCSCDMCCNPRKHVGPTIQELRFDQNGDEDA